MKKAIQLAIKTIVLAVVLAIVFVLGAGISGIGQSPKQRSQQSPKGQAGASAPNPAATGAAGANAPSAAAPGGTSSAGTTPNAPGTTANAPGSSPAQPANILLLLFVASLIEAISIAYFVAEAKPGGWKITVALFLLMLNMWVQAGIESAPYLGGHVSAHFGRQSLMMGLVIAILIAPFGVWLLGGFKRDARNQPVAAAHWTASRWPASRWVGTLALSAVVFVALYYLCGYYIAWQNPALRQYYSGSTAIRSFWGQMAWTWSSTPWMFPFQAGRGVLFVLLTIPAVRMLRGGAGRVAYGTALLYMVWDGAPGLLLPSPIFPATVAHSHMVELAVWGLLFGAFVGWAATDPRALWDRLFAR